MPMSQQGTRNSRRAPGEKDFTKRRTVDEGLALSDAAHAAVWRLYARCSSSGAPAASRSVAAIGAASASRRRA